MLKCGYLCRVLKLPEGLRGRGQRKTEAEKDTDVQRELSLPRSICPPGAHNEQLLLAKREGGSPGHWRNPGQGLW